MEDRAVFPPGTLAVVSTPIGNPGDITLRALQVLEAADLLAAEDTRTARRLLSRHGLSRPLVSYHDWNEAQRAEALLDRLRNGARVALITEAGTPGVSDPGYDVVRLARERGVPVLPVPGPSALTAFLSVSGLPTNAFSFFGFPPSRPGPRSALFRRVADRPETLVFYESPRRIVAVLRDALRILGDRRCALGREMTKLHEEFLFGSLGAVLSTLETRPKVLGEICWGVAGVDGSATRAAQPEEALDRAARAILRKDLPLRSSARELAEQFRLPMKDAYRMLSSLRKGGQSVGNK